MKGFRFFCFLLLIISCGHGSKNQKFMDQNLDAHLWQERFENRSRDVYKHRKRIVAAMKLQKGQRIADIGVGTGLFIPYFIDAVAPTGHVYGVDVSPGFVKYLRNRKQEHSWQHFTAVLSHFTKTTLDQNSIDVVFICDSYHHFDKPRQMMEDIKNILTDSARLYIVDFNKIPGVSRPWILQHMNLTKKELIDQLDSFGFHLVRELNIGLEENFMLEFAVKKDKR